ncbi:DUF881 domain-containing protein [Bacillus rubiinfantis]|uniref:DUF881 domain-containing protein n=1 Tax=Bacillus rubiinfantis TaxID=1499680 RepID=UPI000A4A0559
MVTFTFITVVIGFMLAVQFQTVQQPVERDTRDIWQLREALLNEKEVQSNLLAEIRLTEEKLAAYDSKRKQNKEQALRDTLEELKTEAGVTDITGPGITLIIEAAIEATTEGKPMANTISPELLQRLLNELNMYDAKYVAIDDQRIINTTVIRDINKETKIDGHTINKLPLEIKVVVNDQATAEKLYNQMTVSKAQDEFFIESLRLKVGKPSASIKVPAYSNPIRIQYLEPVKEGGGS